MLSQDEVWILIEAYGKRLQYFCDGSINTSQKLEAQRIIIRLGELANDLSDVTP